MFARRQLRRTSLFALFALLWSLFSPALVQAGVGRADAPLVEICTAHGVKKVAQSLDLADTKSASSFGAQHCVLCCLDLGAHAGPSASTGFVRAEQVAVPLAQPQHRLPQQIILLNAPPRAPPLLSFR